jgi:Zn-dependent peptidase ImmA (M78 family)
MHRKKASVGERALKQIHAELNLRLMHIRRYLSAVDLKTELGLPWIDVDEGGGPREIARTLRSAWLIPQGPINNLTEYCERAGILVMWCKFDAPVDGVTMRVRDLPPCIFLNSKVTADRMRHSLAHELGHLIMHRIPTDNIEDEANTFAAEFLVPEKLFRNQVIGNRVSLEFLARQKAYWRVSMASILYQAGDLSLITRHQSEYIWKLVSSLGWRTREPAETDFPHEETTLFPKILRLHCDELGYDLDDLSQLVHASPSDMQRFYGHHLGSKRHRLSIVRC